MIFSSKWDQRLIQKISIVFGIDCPFYIYCRCRNCPVTLRNKLSFRKQTRPDNLSFWNDRKYDCHFQSTKKENTHPLKKDGLYSFPNASIFIISKGKSIIISKRQSIVISKRGSIIISKRESIIISKWKPIHHFEKRINRHFETRVHPSFRNDSAASFQNDSFVCDKSPINLK